MIQLGKEQPDKENAAQTHDPVHQSAKSIVQDRKSDDA